MNDMPQQKESSEIMYGQWEDYTDEKTLERRANDITEKLEARTNTSEGKMDESMRTEVNTLLKNMMFFLSKYPLDLTEFNTITSSIKRNIYDLAFVNIKFQKAKLVFADLAGKKAKFRARMTNVPPSEKHFLSRGFSSSQLKPTGSV